MFDAEINADVMFVSQGKTVKVSRDIVSPKSKVLKRIVDKEAQRGDLEVSTMNPLVLVVQDIEYEALRAFLKYLYTSKIDIPDVPTALKLYNVAIKYHVPLLRDLADIFICRNLKDGNVINMIKTAQELNSDTIKNACLDFICNKRADIRDLPGILELDNDSLITVIEKMWAKQFDSEYEYPLAAANGTDAALKMFKI
jgi:hypothetical protein